MSQVWLIIQIGLLCFYSFFITFFLMADMFSWLIFFSVLPHWIFPPLNIFSYKWFWTSWLAVHVNKSVHLSLQCRQWNLKCQICCHGIQNSVSATFNSYNSATSLSAIMIFLGSSECLTALSSRQQPHPWKSHELEYSSHLTQFIHLSNNK